MSVLMYGVPTGNGVIQLQLADDDSAVVLLVLRAEYDAMVAELERLRSPDLRIVYGYELGFEEGQREQAQP